MTWISFDGSNSIVHLVILTILMPWFFADQWQSIAENSPHLSTLAKNNALTAWGYFYAGCILVASILSWIIGRYADKRSVRSIYFRCSLGATIIALGFYATYVAGWHSYHVTSAALLLILFTVTLFLYDTMLIDSSGGQEQTGLAKTSATGWAFGYLISGVVLLSLFLAGFFDDPLTKVTYTKSLVIVILLFGTGSILALRFWPSDLQTNVATPGVQIGKFGIPAFLVGSFCLMDAITTLTAFVTILSKDVLGFSLRELVAQYLLFHLVALFTTYFLPPLMLRKWDVRGSMIVLTLVWLLICVLGAAVISLGSNKYTVSALLFMLALMVGTTPSIIRASYAAIIPLESRARHFSYAVVTQKTFTFVGPFLAALLMGYFGSPLLIPLSIIPFLLVALLIFLKMKRIT